MRSFCRVFVILSGYQSMPTILITGADGFVGRHLVPVLRERGHHAIPTSQHTRADSRILLLNGLATDWTSALMDVEILVHLAGIAHRHGIDANTHHDITVNSCRALINALPECPKLKKIIFLSTAKVWGDTSGLLDQAFTDQSPAAPAAHDGYAQAKYAAEQILMTQDRVPVIIFRPPLIYGAGVKANFAKLLNICAHGLPGGLPLPLESVHNRRSFLDVEALCDAITHVAAHPISTHKIYGLADQKDWSTSELLRFLTQEIGGRLWLMPCPLILLSGLAKSVGKSQLADQLLGNFRLDCRQFQTDFNWAPPQDAPTAMKKLAHLFRETFLKTV